MRILITNDDGISAPGLSVLEGIANELAGKGGEVWVVAPAFEQSGVSHCISYVKPMRMQQLGPRKYAIEGSPADCVLVALGQILNNDKPDLILSGVNMGYNVAEDTLYSGTIGAAMEGAMHGYKSIAMSQYYGKNDENNGDYFENARKHGVKVCKKILDAAPWQNHTYGVFYNVNFPLSDGNEVKGMKVTRQGHRPNATFGVEPQSAPNGRTYYWLKHTLKNHQSPEGTDARESSQGWITVTPLRADLTAHDIVSDLEGVF